MYIALNWLKELVDCQLDPETLAQTLTLAGFEVESIDDRSTWADGVVVGRVLTRIQHPNADKLSVCTVDVGGTEPLQIVCGAANVRAGIHVAVATVGTYLPKVDLKIKPAKLRGEKSEGMICSVSELGLAKDSDGIHIFGEAEDPHTPAIGTDVRPLLGLDDVILDLSSTANRADALSMVGIAREVAALTGGKLKLPTADISAISKQPQLSVNVSEGQACPVYSATLIEGVQIAPAPEWLQSRLQAAGIRPINNVVDVTNYILLEWGQPLHAFDADKLQAVSGTPTIQMGVRYAEKQGEALKTLDGQERPLHAQNLLITASNTPVALAGVMGGETTEVGAGTQNIVLEAAIFDPVAVRKSARSQGGMRSEASTRYERGVNLAELETATHRAIELLLELAGGKISCQDLSDRRPDFSQQPRTIKLRLVRLNQILGPINDDGEPGEISSEDVERTLSALGCQLTASTDDKEETVWDVAIPPYRYRDLEREIDLIEEVARLYGYDRFMDTLPSESAAGFLSLDEELLRRIRAAFRAVGLNEVVQYSYATEKLNNGSQVEIINPMFAEYATLRSELISGLIQSFQTNLAQGNGALQAFEISKIFGRDETGLIETDVLAGIIGGDPGIGRWTTGGKPQPLSWYQAKGMLDSVCASLSIPVEYQADRSDPKLHPGRTASLWLQGQKLGYFGQLHPQLRQEQDLPAALYVFQLNLDPILNYLAAEERLVPVFKNYSTYPASDRDIAFFAPVELSLAEIHKSITKAGGELLEEVAVFDEYRGENVPNGQRSLAIRSIYRALDRTLTEAEIEPLQQKIRDVLVDKFRVTLRS
ncbi:phenylalanine--tRNA ligase subunit beta [Chamaesiphon sp. OTE_75_metabat_556]|uniref:phenylalanine--tRNA ligase subunit beta n=1 Tax=Chamaesiphon sp. OTE_75_metabat_556 TaxID=2964692 RepID=UPI00286A708D|nr:phenylalanine--tRNA ligase subunit beta [Chamaesiphon sp. OTE_75_metabat_556]